MGGDNESEVSRVGNLAFKGARMGNTQLIDYQAKSGEKGFIG